MQKFISMSVNLASLTLAVQLTNDWRIFILMIVCGMAGVAYGDAK